MTTTHTSGSIGLHAGSPDQVDADLLIVPCFEDASNVPAGLDAAIGGELTRAMSSGEFKGKPYDLMLTPVVNPAWRARRAALIGAGCKESYTSDRARKVAAAAGLAARQRHIGRVAFWYQGNSQHNPGEFAQAIAEGLTLAEFDSAQYKTGEAERGQLTEMRIAMDANAIDAPAVSGAIDRGRTLGESSNIARALANEPSNTLTPREFADRAAAIARAVGVGVEILDEHRIAELGMGLLLGVARGSDEPPRLVVLRHDPPGAPERPVLGLIGKGITFDTGGISIKPADGMERMKDDMSGGAAVIGAMRAIAMLKAPIRVIGIVPATENMPGGSAIKPGDILKSANGKTVEVINTDAEGRLILGDGLWYAQKLGATHLVDVATLTGACVVALGKITTGLFGTPDAWVEEVRRVAEREGDRAWPMPIFEEYQDQLKSEIADMTNTGGRPAGAITAALFIKEFSGGLPWVHMDIAGTAWSEEARPYQAKGATGVAVRTLAELAFTSDRWPK